MIETVYLSLGSNIKDREAYIEKALKTISLYPETEIIALSSIYETEPIDMALDKDSLNFLNLCCALKTSLGPFKLLALVQKTEQKLGRNRTKHATVSNNHHRLYLSRTIDIDILLYGKRVLYTRDLIVPHPLLHERRFVLEPLSEIAGNVIHQLFRLTVNELKDRNVDRHCVKYVKNSNLNEIKRTGLA